MTNNFDWIVIGGGITGSALSYELVKKGFRVLLLEKDPLLHNATYYSYGGIAYWSGTTELTQKLCREGIEIHQNLAAELDADTEFRSIDLLLTIEGKSDPQAVCSQFQQFAIQPELLSVEESCQLEPLLNPDAIAGCLKLPHGHINPNKLNIAYQQAFKRLGGELKFEKVVSLRETANQIEGVTTSKNNNYHGKNVVVCTGALTRQLLHQTGIEVPIYFSQAQLIKTAPTEIELRTLVMPATLERLLIEREVTQPEKEHLWQEPNHHLLAGVIEAGAIQFLDRSICMGQISQIITNPDVAPDLAGAEAEIRQKIAIILPFLSNIKGTCHHCQVAFSRPDLPFMVQKVPNKSGLLVFSGFTSPFAFVPPLARHFADHASGEQDPIIAQITTNNDEYSTESRTFTAH